MKLSAAIKEANRRATELHGLRLRGDERSRVASSLFAIAQQHHSAILLLLGNAHPLHSPAFALLRLLIEATMRGAWVLRCAKDEQVANVIEGNKKQIDMSSMFSEIEKSLNNNTDHELSIKRIYTDHWKVLSAYTHSYEQQVQRWLITKDIEPNYSSEEISELINRADIIAKLAFELTKSLHLSEQDKISQISH